MGDRIDDLFQEWYWLGGAVLLAEVNSAPPTRSAEQIIAESTTYCRESGRLTWVVLDWLIRHSEQIDVAALLRETDRMGDSSVLGVLCDAAHLRKPDPKFERIIHRCRPASEVQPFFRRVARSRLALAQTRANALDVFRRWNYLCNELRYL